MINPFEALKIVRLLVREKSGAWYVDQGFMTRSMADERRRDWNTYGFGCLMLKHSRRTVRIVNRPIRGYR
jgi:hypothetical protein